MPRKLNNITEEVEEISVENSKNVETVEKTESYKEKVIKNSKIDAAPGKEKSNLIYNHDKMGDYNISFDDDNKHTAITFNPVTGRIKVAEYGIIKEE
jgi:hypothetical protein